LGVKSGPAFRVYIATHSVTWKPGKTRIVIPKSGGRRTWSTNPEAYPVLTKEDRRRLAFGNATTVRKRARSVLNRPWLNLPGTEIITKTAVTLLRPARARQPAPREEKTTPN